MTAPGFDMPDHGPLYKPPAKEKEPPSAVERAGIDPKVLAQLVAELEAAEAELGVLTRKGRAKR